METATTESEVKTWLDVILAKKHLGDYALEIKGSAEQGSGQCGDIIFVQVTAADKKYNLAIKKSTSRHALMAQSPAIRDAFINESYIYGTVFPNFEKFCEEKGVNIDLPVPKFYGMYSDEVKDVIALENMKASGYEMWDTCTPLTREHVDLVVKEYAKIHSISVAMQKQNPQRFSQLSTESRDAFGKFFKRASTVITFKAYVDQLHDLLKDDLTDDDKKKLLGFKGELEWVFHDLAPSEDELKVFAHIDCWNNNFMYKYKTEDKGLSAVTIFDWQMSKLSSPFCDLSYFLFACISDEDIMDLDTILEQYYINFCDSLESLGCDFGGIYSTEKFRQEFRKFAKYGFIMAVTILKASYTRRTHFSKEVNAIDYKNRMKSIVRYVIESGVI